MKALIENYGDAIIAVICGLLIFGIFASLFIYDDCAFSKMLAKFLSYYL